MRTQNRNKVKFYFAPFSAKVPITHEDEWGNILETGEQHTIYGPPILMRGNISAAKGETEARMFGESLQYDKVIVLADPNTPIDEFSVLYVEKLPIINEDGTTDSVHDYIVRKVARSLNSVSIAISRVNVSI